ncbi:hypothetical protein F5J12DRAFT_824936 [Pisolithus orientalis]|uniref:uncharacterized protein n=1 Tax=Pisolithus orientalis TaxID=936130 RepID=UPI002224ED6A|nr:uncharacterized protein F5J12DRAFT_824936 [Pisolithus orientalis]KAI6008691.1 hypothetical protein F5J12DRAFT_824936 [Pisolithus orientalis]
MTTLLTVNTVVYPDVEYADTETVFLQPLIVMVCFSGPVPQRLIHTDIPIEISASISEEYKGITLPVIHAKAWSAHQSERSTHSIASLHIVPGSIDQEDSAGDFPIPFLPLASTFDPMDTCHWATLSKDTERWLVNDVWTTSVPQWAWGRDAFWLAYIAAHPMFPNGSWSAWDPRIPMEGQFIEEWLNDDGMNGSADGMSSNETAEHPLLSNIWESFSRHIALFYPFVLIPVS